MKARGFALVEVILALMVLEVAIVVGHRALQTAHALLSEGIRREHALSEAEAVLDSLSWFGVQGAGTRRGAWGRVEWSGGGAPSELTLDVFAPGAVAPYARFSALVP